jgi:hypothetical protein
MVQFHRKHPSTARHINAALFNSISFTREDLATSWQSSRIVTPHLWRGGNVRGHPSISLPPISSSSSLLYSHLPSHTHPCSYVHSPTLCTITRYQTLEVNDSQTSKMLTSVRESTPIAADIPLPPPLLPLELRTSFRHIGTGPRDTMAPSAITWTPIYGRLGTRRLGTAFLCISL